MRAALALKKIVLHTLLLTCVLAAPLVTVGAQAAYAATYPSPPPSFVPVGPDNLYRPANGRNSRPLLVILNTFTDIATPSGFDAATIGSRIFGPGSQNLAGYFAANSFNAFSFSRAAETQGTANDGVVVVNVGKISDYLKPLPGGGETSSRENRQSLDAAAAFVDFSKFDRNNDGNITDDELTILNMRVAQNSGEFCGATRGVDGPPTYNGKTILKQVSMATSATDLLTITHEVAHSTFHTRDLYGFGVGAFDLFGPTCGGGVNDMHSFNFNAWQKKNLGWITPTVVTRDGFYDVPRADTNPTSFILYDPDRGTNDYFMVENREPALTTGYDKSATDNGLVIWRADDTQYSTSDDSKRPIEIMRPDGATDPGCSGGTCYGGSQGDAWDPSRGSTPQRAMTRPWRDGTAAKVAVRAIGDKGQTVRAYFDVRGPGILVDTYGLPAAPVNRGAANVVTFPVMNTGESPDTFNFTLRNLPQGWTASTETQTLGAGASGTAHVTLTPASNAPAGSQDLLAVGTSATDGSVTTSGTRTVQVVQAQTTTVVTSSVNPSVYGQPVTFTATVTPNAPATGPTPTGGVLFTVDGSALGVSVALSNGQATSQPISNLSVGPHTVAASYFGDANSLPSNGRLTQTVNKADTFTILGSSANPSDFGVPVTFGATVTPLPPSTTPASRPTGTVTYGVDGVAVTTVTLDAATGQASFTTTGLQPGSHTVTAAYSGDGNFKPSTGTVVQRVTCTTTLTGNQKSMTLGSGSTCFDGATIKGGLSIGPGAAVALINSTVTGGVTSNGANTFRLCSSNIGSGLTVAGTTGFVLLGGHADDGCGADSIGGGVTVRDNRGGVEIIGTGVGGGLSVTGSSGVGPYPDDVGTQVGGNSVHGSLSCSGNTPAATDDGSPNSVGGGRSGECASKTF